MTQALATLQGFVGHGREIVRIRTTSRRARLALRALGVVAALSLALFLSCWALVLWGDLVDPARFARPDDAVTVVDRHGRTLRHARVSGADRRWVPLSDISPVLLSAVLSTEDAGFHRHRGVDARAVGRALVMNLLPWRRRSGASTITQQLVKRVYPRRYGVLSKGLEVLRALALERVFTKDEILEQYLNRLPFGDNLEGVARASEEYFGHPASTLSLSEAALLAGIPQAPSVTEPRRHLRRALARRAVVLGRMLATGAIDRATYESALAERPTLREAPARPWEAPRFVDAALSAWRAGELTRRDGALATSLDLALQRRAETVLAAAVARFSPRGARNAAGVVVANATGEILAYVGAARGDAESPGGALDLLRAPRQPGSSLKPFVYELFFERGGTAASVLDDTRVAMQGARGTSFEARDYDGRERGPVRARIALAGSLNLAALDAARRVGADALVARLRALGFRHLGAAEHLGAAVVLGGGDVTALELAGAYTALARGGSRVPLTLQTGERVRATPVLQPAAARVTWDVLADGRARADTFGADLVDLAPGVPFALKTGTSQGWRDAWAAVSTSLVTVVVWLGDPGGNPMASVPGFEASAPAAVRIAAFAHERALAEGLTSVPAVSPRLVEAGVCADTGLRPGPRCRHVVHERFAPGSLPTSECSAHDARGTWILPARYAAWAERHHPSGIALSERTSAPMEAVPVVVSPRTGTRWLIDPARPAPTVDLRAAVAGTLTREVLWELDGRPLEGSRWTLTPGEHALVAVRGDRRSLPSRVEVRAAAGSAPSPSANP